VGFGEYRHRRAMLRQTKLSQQHLATIQQQGAMNLDQVRAQAYMEGFRAGHRRGWHDLKSKLEQQGILSLPAA
jgi:hypothetical protein